MYPLDLFSVFPRYKLFPDSWSQTSSYSPSLHVTSVEVGGGCRFVLRNKAMIPVIWYSVEELIAVSILEGLGL